MTNVMHDYTKWTKYIHYFSSLMTVMNGGNVSYSFYCLYDL